MTKQEEIRYLIHTLGIKLGIIAEKLGIKVQTLSYLINESPQFDDDLYKKIKEIIDDYQFELNLFEGEYNESLDLFTSEEAMHLGIGERLRLFAKRKYGTLKKLAEAMKISPQQLQQYISGKREPGSKILTRLLRLGCDVNWLLGGKEALESYKIYRLESELRRLQQSFNQINSVIQKVESGH
ncbi:MAG TPA: helix-turn-helix transcriptional regulator [Melioribacteraceae bacterium]|nr:helix-turn-helix transcriptional regulator [Melioribacteraceae bacterium]